MGIVRANVRFGIDIWDEHHCRRWIWRILLVQIIADTAIDPAAQYAQSPCVRLRLDADQLPLCAADFVAHPASGLGAASHIARNGLIASYTFDSQSPSNHFS